MADFFGIARRLNFEPVYALRAALPTEGDAGRRALMEVALSYPEAYTAALRAKKARNGRSELRDLRELERSEQRGLAAMSGDLETFNDLSRGRRR